VMGAERIIEDNDSCSVCCLCLILGVLPVAVASGGWLISGSTCIIHLMFQTSSLSI
jgi:hypothetical protein